MVRLLAFVREHGRAELHDDAFGLFQFTAHGGKLREPLSQCREWPPL
jgi:hypothetical protein